MGAALDDPYATVFDLIDDSVRIIDSSAPIPGQVSFEWFRLAKPAIPISVNVL